MTGTISRNKMVYITYSILDESGQVFEQHDLPIGYVHGVNSPLLEKTEMALEGRNVGARIEVMIPPEDGFGPHRPELTFTDDIEWQVHRGWQPSPGRQDRAVCGQRCRGA